MRRECRTVGAVFIGSVWLRLAQRLTNFFWCHLRIEASDNVTFAVDEKFGEIPGDVLFTLVVRLSRLEHLIKRTGAITIHFDFGEQRKIGVVIGCGEFENFTVASRLLCTKLVARESQDRKVIVFVLFLQSTQPGVLWRKASATRDVNDQTHPAFVRSKIYRFAGD